MPKFSIITVCFNAVSTIENTIKSVISQDSSDYEYIIVDGLSTDGTCELIDKYAGQYSNIRYISEKDQGLYDAMNKGLAMARGEYIEFLNSGDTLFESGVLSRIAKYCSAKKEILYGNITYVNPDGSENARMYGKSCGKPIYYATGDCINHQTIFAHRDCFKCDGNDFDKDSYRICADRDWMMRQSKDKVPFVACGEMTVKYSLDEESVSVRDKKLLEREEKICIKRHYPLLYPIYLIFNGIRKSKVLSGLLHGIYKLLYIR